MNTIKIGDEFEKKSLLLIQEALNNYELSIIPAHCTVFSKQKYFSSKRKGNIIFDLSIEVKHPLAKRPAFLYLIECKKYNKPVPVDDIEEFDSKINGIEGVQVKGVFITNNGFQKGALEVAKTLGLMLLEVNDDTNDYKIILHKSISEVNKKSKNESLDSEIEKIIKKALLPQKIIGLKTLSLESIENLSREFLNSFNKNILSNYKPISIDELIIYLKNEKNISVNFSNRLVDSKQRELLGYFDIKKNEILIDNSIKNTIRFPFVFAHELGHYVLHSNLKSNQSVYDDFQDSEHNLFTQKNHLQNDKNWIEWQANSFASCILMPKETVIARLINIQTILGISKQGNIYLDHQPVNKIDYRDIITNLSEFFGVSKLSVEYRLESLKLIKRPLRSNNDDDDDAAKEFLRKLSILNSKNNSY